MAQYGLTGKLLGHGDIIGYFIVDANGKELLLSKDKVIQFAENGLITNWEVTIDEDGEKHLYSRDISLMSIPNSTKDREYGIKILGRLVRDGKHVGFIGVDSDGQRRTYTIDRMWNLVRLGRVEDVTAMKYNGSRVLLSKDNALRDIPEYNVSN